MTKVGTRLIQAAKEAAAIARGQVTPARIHLSVDIDVKATTKS